jgi:tellurite resistance protein TehA-like permease
MTFSEVNIFGVYVAPISVMILAAWLVTLLLRWLLMRSGLMRHVWHPSLFAFSVFLIVLSLMVLGTPAVRVA